MRTFNVRLAAVLLAIAVVFCGGTYWLHGYQVRRNANMFLAVSKTAQQRAADAAKKKDSRMEQEATNEAVK